MRQEDRLGAILALLADHGSVGVVETADRLGTSQATIRRDLQALEEQGLVKRTHGGAVPAGVLYELPMRYRGARQQEEKSRIAELAAGLIDESAATVGLCGGTTTSEVARFLGMRGGLKIVTNALNIAAELALRPAIDLVVTGGTVRTESYELIGPVAERALEGFNLDASFLGVGGVSAAAGVTTHHEVEAQTNRAMILQSARVIVVADGTKVGRRAFARIAEAALVSDLVTDPSADPDELDALRELGVRIHLAD
ncbi:transcriptional regulator, DeoR family [Catenulispora acidiphila DSM 44928]|uniref:Transcriptional regulator, DeoR family n=1 Tax=Catenulispora acidiphila (strain DSM 44928 / JCM 14897 / NBRC 102108 / NRRL B-24433 / ID139908) TaxID=479433 RepID=C7QF10_CATAD|nr:DeoR/GlpR family DNA-binding transcription regulator [Catenulispora acidiphila]ACU74768.1 transcriptional regulator, DeoR family [Catenulispora acidiphila DSM 44928]